MDDVLRYTTQRLPDIVEWIGQLVKLESPTNDKAAVDRAVEFVADRLSPFAKVKLYRQKQYGHHLRAEFKLPRRAKKAQSWRSVTLILSGKRERSAACRSDGKGGVCGAPVFLI